MKHSITLISFFLIISNSIFSQNRVDKPFQIQLNGSGVFFKTFGNAIADSEIDDLSIRKWGIPGLSLGYHLNKRIYIGYSFQPNRNLILKEPWTLGIDENDGNITLDHNTGSFHSVEGRYFPFKFDFYGSLFLTHTSRANYNMQFNRTGTAMAIGNNSYETDIQADWNFKSLNTIGIGLGYNYVHKSGFSFDLGFGLPIPLSEPLYENIKITSIEGVVIEQNDIEIGRNKIENELFYFPVQLHLNIGYNLNFI